MSDDGKVIHLNIPKSIQVERDRLRAEEVQRRYLLTHAVRSAIKFQNADDLVWPAQKISELRARARRDLGTANIASVLERKGIKTKHWERLSIDHSMSFSEAVRESISRTQSRRDPLGKSVKKYVALLEGLADLLSLDRDEVIFDAFKNTKFSNIKNTLALSSAQQLTWDFLELSNAVTKSEKLQDYFCQLGEHFGIGESNWEQGWDL